MRQSGSGPSRLLLSGLVTASLTMLVGCEPTCERTCKKLLSCEDVDSPRVHEDECIDSCDSLADLYDSWDDTQLQDQLAETKRCVVSEECDAIAAGVCYDEDLYTW